MPSPSLVFSFCDSYFDFFFPCLDAYSKRWGFEGISCIEKFLVKMLRCSNISRLVLWFAEHSSRNNMYCHHLWHVWKIFTIYYSWFIYLVVLPCCINVRHYVSKYSLETKQKLNFKFMFILLPCWWPWYLHTHGFDSLKCRGWLL